MEEFCEKCGCRLLSVGECAECSDYLDSLPNALNPCVGRSISDPKYEWYHFPDKD